MPGERIELPTNGLQNRQIDAYLRVGASQALLYGQKTAKTNGLDAYLRVPEYNIVFPDSQQGISDALTDATVAAIAVPEGKSEIIVFDARFAGFGVRVRRGGSRRFIFQYKLGGTHRRVTFKEANVKRATGGSTDPSRQDHIGQPIRHSKRKPPMMPLATPSSGAWSDISLAPKDGGGQAR